MATNFYEGRDLEILGDMPNYYAWIMAGFAPYIRGDTIEYGAGTGTISALLAVSATTLTLVEPSRNLIESLRRQLSHRHAEVINETLEVHTARTATESADTIVLVNVLEHIRDDRAALAHFIRILRPGGHLLIFVPALEQLMSKLDRQHGHFRRYHRPDLTAKVMVAGGHVIECRYFDMLGVAPWFVLNKALGSTAFNPILVHINDAIIVPLSRALERIVTPPFGKNLLLVASKLAVSA